MAVRTAVARIASVDARWSRAELVARPVVTSGPAMPLTDMQLMKGARERAEAVRELLVREHESADIYVGLETGFHSITLDGCRHTFLRGWAYAMNEATPGNFGLAPSITVPPLIVQRVERTGRELGEVLEEISNEFGVRSQQGAWGVLARDLLKRSTSFEAALVAALAPFYNGLLYS